MGGSVEDSHVANNNIRKQDPFKTFQSKNGDALAYESGAHESDLTTQESGGLEILGLQSRGCMGEGPGQRQSSIDTEPPTLDTSSMRDAKKGAVEVMERYEADEALHLFLKDAQDEELRQKVLRPVDIKQEGILPTHEPDFVAT